MMLGDLGFALKLPSEVTRTGNCTGPKNIKEHQRTSGSNMIQLTVQLLDTTCILNPHGKKNHPCTGVALVSRPPGHWHGGDAQSSGCAISQATRPRRDAATRQVPRCAALCDTGALTRPNRASHRQAHPKPAGCELTCCMLHESLESLTCVDVDNESMMS